MSNLTTLALSPNPFEGDWGLDDQPCEMQKMIADFYDVMAVPMEEITRKAFEEDVTGEGINGYLLLSDMEFLLVYLMIINHRMEEYRASSECGVLPPRNQFIEQYSLDCIRKTFMCKGIKIDPLLRFDIMPAYKVFDLGANATDTGIDFMYIEGHDDANCSSHETFFVS